MKNIAFICMIVCLGLAIKLVFTGDKKLSQYNILCVNGVEYINTYTGITTAYTQDGEIKNCKKIMTVGIEND